MTKIPEHLQKKIREMAHAYDQNCWRNEPYNCPPEITESFNEGAAAMHSLMIEELRPLVEALEKAIKSADFFSRHADCQRDTWACRCEFCRNTDATIHLRESRQALSHYRERIEGMK